MPKSIHTNQPYPTTDGICPDAYSLRIVSPAYASNESELNAILQYIYHSVNFEKSARRGRQILLQMVVSHHVVAGMACSSVTASCALSISVRTSPMPKIRDAILSG